MIAASHENSVEAGDVLPGGRGGGAVGTFVLERDHLLAAPGGSARALRQTGLIRGARVRASRDRWRYGGGGSRNGGWRRRRDRHVGNGGRCQVELADAARHEVLEVQGALLLAVLVVLVVVLGGR